MKLNNSRRLMLFIALGFGMLPMHALSQDKLSKFLLMKLSRDQSAVLCRSALFTQCMKFSQAQCLELSEKALQTCLAPLPDTVNLADLQNATLEACPKAVYEEAGYSDTRAQQCLKDAMKE